MIKKEDIQEGIINREIAKHFSKNPDVYECFICRRKVEYQYLDIDGKQNIFGFQRGFEGKNRIICERCFRASSFLDMITSKIMILIFRR